MAEFVQAGSGRLSIRLAATLEPGLQDALDHPVRRELLRVLNRSGRARDVAEIGTDLRGFRLSQLAYHLQVLRRSGSVASLLVGDGLDRTRPQYASEVSDDQQVRAVLRATERWDRERREAAAAADTSPLLTMFRVPQPVQTVRLRARGDADGDRFSG